MLQEKVNLGNVYVPDSELGTGRNQDNLSGKQITQMIQDSLKSI